MLIYWCISKDLRGLSELVNKQKVSGLEADKKA